MVQIWLKSGLGLCLRLRFFLLNVFYFGVLEAMVEMKVWLGGRGEEAEGRYEPGPSSNLVSLGMGFPATVATWWCRGGCR